MLRRKSLLPGSRTARPIKLTLTLVVVAVSLSIVGLAIGSRVRRGLSKKSEAAALSRKPTSGKAQKSEGKVLVRRGQLLPHLRDALQVLGNRLQVPGSERITLTGTLSRGEVVNTSSFLLIQEFPSRVRFQQQGVAPRIAIFDGQEAWKPGGRPDRFEEEILETLAYDSADRLFIAQAAGATTRFLGSRFSLDDGQAPGHAGPVYDVYQINDQVRVEGKVRSQTKSFYLNSDTLLLERVRYELERDGARAEIEVRFGDWRDVQGQKLPFRVTRVEAGAPTMTLTVISALVGPRMNDGIFTKPQETR